MNTYCLRLQERLAETGPRLLAQDKEAERHCTECAECFDFLEALPVLDSTLRELPAIDVSQATVDALLARVAALPSAPRVVTEVPSERPTLLHRAKATGSAFFRSAGNGPFRLVPPVPFRHAVLGILALVLVLSLDMKDIGRVRAKPRVSTRSKVQERPSSSTEQYADLIQAFKNDLDEAKREQAAALDQASRNALDIREHKERVSGVFETLVDKFENLQRDVDSLAGALKQQNEPQEIESIGHDTPSGVTAAADRGIASESALEKFKMQVKSDRSDMPMRSGSSSDSGKSEDSRPEEAVGMKAPSSRVDFIAPGDSVSVKLLSGVNAPIDGTPYPVVFALEGPINGPDGKTLEYSEARLLAAAEGSENDGRALYRLKHLDIKRSDGSREQFDVDGWIIGRDGIRGTPGKMVDKLGKSIVAAASTSPEIANFQSSAKEFSQILLNRYETLIPVVEVPSGEEAVAIFSKSSGGTTALPQSSSTPVQSEGARYVARTHSLQGISFKDPQGYWANTYVPGDPNFRRLQTVLLKESAPFLTPSSGAKLSLHNAAVQPAQPFDAPQDSALALYLNSERTAIQGPSRFTVQVGIKGSVQSKGRRPAMNMAVVLDLRGPLPTADIQNLLREALFSFHRAKDLGDRFSVFVAGREKTLVLDPNTFTHGQLIVALEELFHQQETSQSQEALLQALKRASVQVGENDDPTAPLGSSSILLLTSHALSADLPELERFAHRSALSGVPLSVFGLGSTVNSEELDRLALSGQGNRRILKSASEAREVAAKEIESSSTSVARAVRLNIRLAPGVKLVDVLGSYKFDPSQALRVKEAERSIDQRVARSLGIPSDRGDDDEGIQIVIPNYHAGDAHVILLDVVAPGPGEIAQVSAKFKDLVHLRNGTAQASLKISSTPSTEGPLEINVMKNRLALDLSNALVTASRKLDQEEVGEAIRTLEEFRQIMLDLPALQTALSGDPEILRDANMLSEYIALLRSPSMQQKSSKLFLRDSLAYAGKRKLAHHLSGTEMTS